MIYIYNLGDIHNGRPQKRRAPVERIGLQRQMYKIHDFLKFMTNFHKNKRVVMFVV